MPLTSRTVPQKTLYEGPVNEERRKKYKTYLNKVIKIEVGRW